MEGEKMKRKYQLCQETSGIEAWGGNKTKGLQERALLHLVLKIPQ